LLDARGTLTSQVPSYGDDRLRCDDRGPDLREGLTVKHGHPLVLGGVGYQA
jgi:hypothetical protein